MGEPYAAPTSGPPTRVRRCSPVRASGSAPGRRLQDDHRAKNLAALHLVERVLDVVEPDRLRHELVEREATLQVQVDERREVARRKTVAVPRRLQRAAP